MAFAHNYIRFNRRQTIKRHNKRAAPAGLENPGAAPRLKNSEISLSSQAEESLIETVNRGADHH